LEKLSYRAISILYLPLALSWALMVMETPLINAFLARGPEPEVSLAAFGVAFSIILVVEAPILMMLELSTALSTSLSAFKAIRRFYVMIGLGVTGLGVALFYTPLSQVLLCRVMNIPPAIAAASVPALRILTWWSFPIGWRRIQQGILIRDGRTRIIGVATGVRLLLLFMTMLVGQSLNLLPGASLSAVAMWVAVAIEALLIHWAGRSSIQRRLAPAPPDSQGLTGRYLWFFYVPLATTTVMRQGIRPVISAGIAAAPMAELSLAAWPVAFSLASMFWGPTMGLRQVTIALAEDKVSWQKVSRFVVTAGLILTGSLAVISYTPLLGVVLRQLFGLSGQLEAFAAPAVRIMVLLPLGYSLHALFTGLLVKQARTSAVRTAKALDLVVVGLTLFAGLRYGGLWGAVLGATALTMGTFVEAVWLYWRSRPVVEILASSAEGGATV
jgi:hypothetical protein